VAFRDQQNQRFDAIVLILVLMAVGAFFWLVAHIHNHVAPQNCHMAGFSSCVGDMPIMTPPHRRDRLE
jgi:hypothetical protein